MTEWKETTLGDICLKITDGAHHSPKEFEGGKPMFSVKNMRDQGFDYNGVKTISEEDFVKLVNSGCQPKSDDILIAKDGSVMKHVFRVKGNVDYVLLSSIAIVRPDIAKVNPSYLVYAIKDPSTTDLILNNFVGGSGVPRIVLKDFKKVDLTIPDIQTQKAIAETLSSLDDKIDLLHRQNKTLEQMAETLFRQWFVAEAKEDWETKKLDEILSISSSKRIFYKEYVDTGIPFYRSKEIIELSKGGATSTELFISEERFNEINSKFGSPNQGDILLTSVGTLGVSYRVRENDKFYFKDGNLTWFSNFQVLPSSIIYCWLNSAIGKEELNNITIGSTQAALTISGLRQIEIIIPPKEVINKLNNDLEAFYSKIEFNQKQIRSIEKMRDALLPKLMSGEVTVN